METKGHRGGQRGAGGGGGGGGGGRGGSQVAAPRGEEGAATGVATQAAAAAAEEEEEEEEEEGKRVSMRRKQEQRLPAAGEMRPITSEKGPTIGGGSGLRLATTGHVLGGAHSKGGRRLLGVSWGEGGRGRRPDDAELWLGLEDAGKPCGLRELRICVRVCVCVCAYMYIYTYMHTYMHTYKICTFNQYNRLKGNNISVGYIDTEMVMIQFNLCKNIKWKLFYNKIGSNN
jgi:hypothetical protein